MKNVGLQVKPPSRSCNDPRCPFHGHLSVRGRVLRGTVVGDKMKDTVVVSRDYTQYVPRFKRFMRKRSHILAHNPPCIGAKSGDVVVVGECRPLSKATSFVVIERIGGT